MLRHDYQIVSDPVVWNIVERHLVPLEAAIRRMVALGEGAERAGPG